MTVSIVWMVYVDYDRPWRHVQVDYFIAQASLAHLEYLDSLRPERLEELSEAKQRLANARQLADDTTAIERQELEQALAEADLEFKKSDGGYSQKSQVLEVTRDTYERILAKHGPHDRATESAHQQVSEEEEEVDRLRAINERWEDERKRIEKSLRKLNEPVQLAQKRVADIEKVRDSALKRDQQYRGVLSDEGLLGGIPIVKMLIHMPLGDFIAPMTTPGRQQIKQLVLPDVRQGLNYLETYTTDRCTTCHIAINDPDFSLGHLATKLEDALPGINEALRQLGHEPFETPLPPVLEADGKTLPAGAVTEHWDELSHEQQDAYFATLLELVNRYMELAGRKTIELGQPILAHPDLALYVSIDSPHPMAKVGCTVCHEGNPQETDFVQAAHSPPTHEIEEEWKEAYYVRHLGIPSVTFETVEHHWDHPMHLPQYTEAGCAKCHPQIADIARFEGERRGGRINLGRHLFTQVGCINCHDVDDLKGSRKVGPDLRRIASKLERDFVQQWVYHPQKFRPSTLMPHFFMQENNRAQSANKFDPDPVLRTQTEVAALTHYLYLVSEEWQPIDKPAEITPDPARGRSLFKEVGCLGCHANLAEFGEEWIARDLVHREGLDEETATFRYRGMTHEQRVGYAIQHFKSDIDTILDPEASRFDPEKPYNPPVFSRFAPELSGIGSKVTFDWLYSWVMDPTHYASATKMPSMRLTPPDAADITAYLLTLKEHAFDQGGPQMDAAQRRMVEELLFELLSAQRSERRSRAIIQDEGGELTGMLETLLTGSLGKQGASDLISPLDLQDRQLAFLGHKMISHYGCYTCHEIRGFEGATPVGTKLTDWAQKPVSQLDFAFYDNAFHDMREQKEEIFGYIYPRDAEALIARSPIPDDAREQIIHTHAAFAKHKMLNPRIWDRRKIKRPYDKLKMPNFYFTEEEAEALTTYLLSRTPARVNDVLKVDYEVDALGPIARGRNLTRELNCNGCHQLEDNAPLVQQYFRRELDGQLTFDELNAPPRLWGQGAKVQHHWLHGFFQNVGPLRPWLSIRMPSFQLTSEQATTLVEYFAALSQRDAHKLAAAHTRIDEYFEAERARTGESEETEQRVASWFKADLLQDSAAQLRRFAVERELIRGRELDTLVRSPERIRQAHERLLVRTRFMETLYDVEYPFVEPAQALLPDDQFELGSRLFNDMGCLKCHVLGRMESAPAGDTDAFVQTYRLDAVRGEGEDAVAIINGLPYRVGSTIDGHTLISAGNIYYDTGDVDTSAVFEGPNAAGETERIQLQAPSAPDLGLTYQRLRRDWVLSW
ncbi:MAG: c-type cytochrome, partial [Planctomycetes bacterium]|nr:c-type cytochrome [Planctomycetota bacterium]